VTLWQSGGLAFGYVVCAIAWLRGGRLERFGASVLLLSWLFTTPANAWEVGSFYPGFILLDGAGVVIFGQLCFRSDRWWPFVVAAAFALTFLGHVLRLLDPALSHDAMVSAHIGLAYVIDLALLLGVWERRLAGEPPAGRAAWAKAAWITRARRGRRTDTPDAARRSATLATTPSDPPAETFVP
jgi:hypothetical protein